MKFTELLQEPGHKVAYYPNLCKITGSALATLFLCQFVYWTNKQRDPDGWIYKNQREIETETGMSRTEQESARKQLIRLRLLEERRVGLPARLEYRPNLNEIIYQWEKYLRTGESEAIEIKKVEGKRLSQNCNRNGSKPRDCQIVQIEQTSFSNSDKQDCPDRTDKIAQSGQTFYIQKLHTENTNTDYTKNTVKQSNKGFVPKPTSASPVRNDESAPDATAKQPTQSPLPGNLVATYRETSNEKPGPGKGKYSAANSTEKENLVRFPVDRYGYIDLPRSPKYKLPSMLTMRTMQFILANEYLGCEFAIDAKGAVYVCDPLHGEWGEEEETFTKLLPLKKMISVANAGIHSEQLYPNTYNEKARWWFTQWVDECHRLGKDAVDIIRRQSIGLWLKDELGLIFEDYEGA